MKKIAFKMKLMPGCRDEYIARHQAIWPELVDLLKAQGVSDYTIFLDEETDTLFAVQKVEKEEGSQSLGNDKIVQRWWAHMADIMETNSDNSPVSQQLTEVFHLD